MGLLRRPLPQNETARRFAGGLQPTTAGQVFREFTSTPTETTLARTQGEVIGSEFDIEIQPGQGVSGLIVGGLNFAGNVLFGSPDAPTLGMEVTKKNTERVQPEVLNEEFKELGLEFEEPTTREAAEIIAQQKRAEIIRQDVLARSSGIAGGAAALGGSLVATAIDPLAVASAFVPVVSQARAAGIIARTGAIRGRAAIGATEGAVGAAAIEPLFASLSLQQQLDYGMSDALMNVGLGAAFGGLAGGVQGLARGSVNPASIRDSVNENLATEGLEPPFNTDITLPKTKPDDYVPEAVRIQSAQAKLDAHRAAIAQMAQGKSVEVDPFLRRQPADARTPETITQWIARTGGVNDTDPTFLGEIANLGDKNIRGPNGKMLGKVGRDGVERNLDDLAEQAVEEGFIRNRDPRELLDTIDRDLRGNAAVRVADEPQLQGVADARASREEAQAALARFDAVRAELEDAGIRDATPEEIDRVDEIMTSDGVDAEAAFERLTLQRANEVAQREMSPTRDVTADFDASAEVDRINRQVFDMESDIDDLQEAVDQMVAAGEIPEPTQAAAEFAANLDGKVSAIERTARQAAACMAR